MISQLIHKGYAVSDPWDIVTIFENKLSDYAGSKYAVCVDSCSNALFLCMKYLSITNKIIVLPKNTYASVPMQCIHAGNKIHFADIEWSGYYYLGGTPIVDGATKFCKNMYIPNTYYCVSFHHRKTLKIGRGGVILTDDPYFSNWARPMIYDGRHKNTMYNQDQFESIGYHMYMTPEEAAIGILKLEELGDHNFDTGSNLTYSDLSLQKIFEPYLVPGDGLEPPTFAM
jgi:dTDP-4-amino-4,6-dideoxygalactose transaminase